MGRTELMLQLSYKCNLNCIHCAYGDIRDSPMLTEPQIRAFLENNEPRLIKISGGEPTICAVFEDAVKICKETGAKVVAFTNGLARPKVHPDYYWVSLFGGEETHNRITQSKTFDRVMEFIRRYPVEYLNSPIFSKSQMQELQSISDRLGIPLRVTRLLPHGTPHETLSLEEQRRIVRELGLNKEPNWVTCSLGFEPPRCDQKMCIKPDGKLVVCTHIIRGLKCPFMKIEGRQVESEQRALQARFRKDTGANT